MNLFIKNSLITFIISSGTIIAMEKKVTHTLMISKHMKHAAYATPEFHATCTPSNLPSNIKDPIIRCTITNIETNKPFRTYIAAKYLFKPETKEPLIEIHHTNNNHHHFRITARCVQNPKLQGNNFLEQLRNIMAPFYKKHARATYVYNENPTKKEPAGVTTPHIDDFKQADILEIKKIIVNVDGKTHKIDKEKHPETVLFINRKLSHSQENIWGHGPNGCPNEKTLIQSIRNS